MTSPSSPRTRADILTETVEIDIDGDSMRAYVARPVATDGVAGVIVAPELFGLSAHVRDVCERLAADGYVALAPDLHHRIAPGVELAHDDAGRKRGMALLQRMTRDQAVDDVRAAVDHLRAQGLRNVGIVGLSAGGHVAYLAATALDLAAAVVVYGGWLPTTDIPLSRPEPTLALTDSITARVLVLVGEEDHVVPAEDRRAIEEALAGAGVRHELVTYPGVPHGFLCDRRATYRAEAAEDAWQRIERLLFDELRSEDGACPP